MACRFHSFHKENRESVISYCLGLVNNQTGMLNRFSPATKDSSQKRPADRESWARAKTMNKIVLLPILRGVSQEDGLPGWLSAPHKPDGFSTRHKWTDLYVARLLSCRRDAKVVGIAKKAAVIHCFCCPNCIIFCIPAHYSLLLEAFSPQCKLLSIM